MFNIRRLETLQKLFDLCKNSDSFFLVSELLNNTRIVQKLFEDRVYNALAYLGAFFSKGISWLIGVTFSYDIYVEGWVYPWFNDLWGDSVVFISFPCLYSGNRLRLWIIYTILDFFLFSYNLSLSQPIAASSQSYKWSRTCSLGRHFRLLFWWPEGEKKCSNVTAVAYIRSHNLIKSLVVLLKSM